MSQRCGNCHHLLTTISGLKPGLGYCAWYEHQPATNRVFPDWIMDALGVVRLDEGTSCQAWTPRLAPRDDARG
jgi:hypothetical protein